MTRLTVTRAADLQAGDRIVSVGPTITYRTPREAIGRASRAVVRLAIDPDRARLTRAWRAPGQPRPGQPARAGALPLAGRRARTRHRARLGQVGRWAGQSPGSPLPRPRGLPFSRRSWGGQGRCASLRDGLAATLDSPASGDILGLYQGTGGERAKRHQTARSTSKIDQEKPPDLLDSIDQLD
jgi:hypothetical protein